MDSPTARDPVVEVSQGPEGTGQDLGAPSCSRSRGGPAKPLKELDGDDDCDDVRFTSSASICEQQDEDGTRWPGSGAHNHRQSLPSQASVSRLVVQMHTRPDENGSTLKDASTACVQPASVQPAALNPAAPLDGPLDAALPPMNQLTLAAGPPSRGDTLTLVQNFNTSEASEAAASAARGPVRSPTRLRDALGQFQWHHDERRVSNPPGRSHGRQNMSRKHHFTYYFPPWLSSRAIIASASLGSPFGRGAKVSVDMPLVIPEEDHQIWSLVMAGNLPQLRHLLAREQNLMRVRNQWGQSIMHVAAKIHQPDVFNFLLSMGMDPNLPDENHKSAATTVLTRRGNQEYALNIDEDDLADRLGWTPLHRTAALSREGDLAELISQALLQAHHGDVNNRDALGRTPLHWLAENGEAEAVRRITQPQTDSSWKANVHVRDNIGFTALHCACWADSLDCVVALLDAGSDVNAQDKHQRTPLLHFSSPEILDLMLDVGADVYIHDDEGTNIMHHVAVADQEALAKALLDRYGYALCTMNNNGDSPFSLTIQNNSLKVLTLWLSILEGFPIRKLAFPNHGGRTVLHVMALYASTDVMDMLANTNLVGLDTLARDKAGHSPDECFMECRNAHCAAARRPFDVERASWLSVMESARRQNAYGNVDLH